jgi:SAM-dependent methyltransferase
VNLSDLMTRGDSRLSVRTGARQIKFRVGTTVWRGAEFRDTAGPHLTIRGLEKVTRLRDLPQTLGWFVRLKPLDAGVSKTIETVGSTSLTSSGLQYASRSFTFNTELTPVPMPWNDHLRAHSELTFSSEVPAGYVVELAVHRVIERKWLFDLAKGVGVEVGPGPKPQVLQGDGVDVRYVEEMPVEKWKELYDTTGKFGTDAADFSKYIIGTADSIPAEPGSLNFIFSSHVFEHLANPLGHLIRWRDLLAPGGVILAVIPEMHSTKDLIAAPSTIDEMESERLSDVWKPTLAHYNRWLGFRGMPHSAEAMMAQNSSIHVHFYDKKNLTELLDKAVREYGFSSYKIVHEDNHKDFHFCLRK